jgi:hypothetical protein
MGSENSNTLNCRKCDALNPVSNAYCAECGAVLKVSTALVKAQPGRVLPYLHEFKFRWLLAGSFVMLGCAVLAMALIALLTALMLGESRTLTLSGMGSAFGAVVVGVTVLVFAFGGLILSSLSRDTRIAESVLASFLAAVLVGIAGHHFSGDFLLLVLLLAVPCAIAAGVGARFGGKNRKRMR